MLAQRYKIQIYEEKLYLTWLLGLQIILQTKCSCLLILYLFPSEKGPSCTSGHYVWKPLMGISRVHKGPSRP